MIVHCRHTVWTDVRRIDPQTASGGQHLHLSEAGVERGAIGLPDGVGRCLTVRAGT